MAVPVPMTEHPQAALSPVTTIRRPLHVAEPVADTGVILCFFLGQA